MHVLGWLRLLLVFFVFLWWLDIVRFVWLRMRCGQCAFTSQRLVNRLRENISRFLRGAVRLPIGAIFHHILSPRRSQGFVIAYLILLWLDFFILLFRQGVGIGLRWLTCLRQRIIADLNLIDILSLNERDLLLLRLYVILRIIQWLNDLWLVYLLDFIVFVPDALPHFRPIRLLLLFLLF